nr:carbohydrate ABC transporter permease [uncultured Niameybacter sp.]
MLNSNNYSKEQKRDILKAKIKKGFLGTREKNGVLTQAIIYLLLICIGFVYLYPLIYMFITSIMSLEDLLDASSKWIPSGVYIKNYIDAFKVMNFKESVIDSFLIAFIPSICQVVICSFAGYGFARYNFRGKKILMAIMILTFVIPPQITMMPTYLLYSDLKLIGSIKALIYPALLGQGFKSAIFILIYYQFYKQIPNSLIEAAQIDGAGHIRTYFSIAIRSVIPAMIVVFLFSFVWYWNETYLTGLYLGNTGIGAKNTMSTLLLELKQFEATYTKMYPVTDNSPDKLNEAIKMAGTIVATAPLLILGFVLQRHLTESIDSSGITGE